VTFPEQPSLVEWFDESGAPALGDLDNHYPYNDARAREHLQWDPPPAQQVLDMADHFLEHGADINTNRSSHQPASILHELVGRVGRYTPRRTRRWSTERAFRGRCCLERV
jgi:hypothetical protein